MRRYLDKLASDGDIRVITREVDPRFELAAVTRAGQKEDDRATLFTRVRGTRLPAITNVYGSRRRLFDIAGVIWRTWDGGDHWYAIDPLEAPADEVRGLHCFDSLTVMGAGGDPDFGFGVGIITTEDGGLNWDYDEEADVLYISIGEPRPAVGVDIGEGVVLRYDEARKELAGLTLIGLRARLMESLISKS